MDDISNLTPAERRREKQRLNIIRVADELYRKNGGDAGGFENTTVEAISEESDISLRTFFRYFESKADVIFLDVPKAVDYMEQSIRTRLQTEPITTALFNARLDQFELFVATKLGRQRMLRALRAPQFQDRLVVLRNQTRQAIIRQILPHLTGSEIDRTKQARVLATIFTDLFADAQDLWARDQKTNIADYVRSCLTMMPALLEQIHDEQKVAA